MAGSKSYVGKAKPSKNFFKTDTNADTKVNSTTGPKFDTKFVAPGMSIFSAPAHQKLTNLAAMGQTYAAATKVGIATRNFTNTHTLLGSPRQRLPSPNTTPRSLQHQPRWPMTTLRRRPRLGR